MKKNFFKKIFAIMLTAILFIQNSVSIQAQGTDSQPTLEDTVRQLQSIYPNSTIRVVDGNIHISVEPADIPATVYSTRVVPSSQFPVISNRGGTIHMVAPSFITSEMMRVYAMVYLPTDIAYAVKTVKDNAKILNAVISSAAENMSNPEIIAYIKANYGVIFTTNAITFLIGIGAISTILWVDITSFNKAYNNSAQNKVYIVQSTMNGYNAYSYFPWDSDYVSLGSWTEYTGTFYEGEYLGFERYNN